MVDLHELIRDEVRQAITPLVEELRALIMESRSTSSTVQNEALNPLLTADEAATVAKVAPKTIRRWVSEGRLKARWAGRQLRIDRQDLETFTKERGRQGRSDVDDVVEKLLKMKPRR
jgi:excisionase family DNA binding protein